MIAGRYTLLREVGRGGSGTVHLAQDEVLGRKVAIKRIGLVPGGANADLVRAEREARLAAALNHPHVVSIFDLVEEDNAHWLVMEYVDGQTLSELVRAQGPLETPEVAMIIGQAAAALADAHAAGIVHRDVKPSNILLTAQLEAKLSDFGIARAESDAALTQTGLVTGSPAYLAPEVASGSTATPASDVWSLGATLFHAVVGRPPYDTTDNLIGALYKIVHEEPPRLPAEHPLAGLLAVTMDKDPRRRWPMGQVRDELGRIGRGEAGTATAGPTAVSRTADDLEPVPPRRPPRRRGARSVWLAGAAALALVAVLAVWMWPGDGTRPAASGPANPPETQSNSVSPAAEASEAAEKTRQDMSDFVTAYLATVTSDPKAAFQQLTPEFQKESGGFGRYNAWWSSVNTASISQVAPNAGNMTVGYTVDYLMNSGRRTTEQIILKLEERDGRYLIAGEA